MKVSRHHVISSLVLIFSALFSLTTSTAFASGSFVWTQLGQKGNVQTPSIPTSVSN